MTSIFNKNPVNFLNQPMFLGEELNVSRFDVQKYPIFEKLTKKMSSYHWTPEEINLSKDKIDYTELEPHEKFIFVSNIKYQTLLDSIQGRGPNLALLPAVSLPELETAIITWTHFESIHSRTYQYILQNLESVKISEIFDSIVIDPAIIARAEQICKYYDDFIEEHKLYSMLGYGKHVINGKEVEITEKGLKTKLYLLVVVINALEGVRFYASFACSFAFSELKKMIGNGSEITLIARDEFQHLAITQNIINNWRRKNDDLIMIEIIKEQESVVYDIYDQVVQQEKDWAAHIFQHGCLVGLNVELLSSFVEFKANERLKAIGMRAKYATIKNPLLWTNKYLNSEASQPAPQETEITSYRVGSINKNMEKDAFKGFEL